MKERLKQLIETQAKAQAEVAKLDAMQKQLDASREALNRDMQVRAGRIAELQFQIKEAETPEGKPDGE